MPPKKDKKKKPKAKKQKKVRLMVEEPSPRFATGYSRPIPGGIIGTGGGGGGGGGMPPASFAMGGYASRMPPPATPLQTPDQFQIQRQLASQGQAIENIVEEQKAVRRGRPRDEEIAQKEGITIEDVRNRRAQQRMPTEMPMTSTPLKQQMQTPSQSVSMGEVSAVLGDDEMIITPSNIKTPVKGRKVKGSTSVMPAPGTAPPEIAGALFPGGGSVRQQGLNMAPPGRLSGSAPDASQSLVGLEGIGDSDVFVGGLGGTLRPQGNLGEGGM